MTTNNFAASIVERLDALAEDKNNAHTVLTNMADEFIAAQGQPPEWLVNMDLSNDSVRLVGNDTHSKAMIIFDVSPLEESQRKEFVSRALLALTRMAQKLSNRRDRN